ncbi:MAG: hypothetical protein M5R36_12275 [Deltaproteobacteria bacterium]|nr:hypothetical protein [Deltaproteobacteria bacterium]
MKQENFARQRDRPAFAGAAQSALVENQIAAPVFHEMRFDEFLVLAGLQNERLQAVGMKIQIHLAPGLRPRQRPGGLPADDVDLRAAGKGQDADERESRRHPEPPKDNPRFHHRFPQNLIVIAPPKLLAVPPSS